MGLVSRQVSLERAGEGGLSLLRRDGYRLLFDLDGIGEAACFRVGGGKRVQDCGILSVGERLRAIREGQSVRAIAERGVRTGCEQAGGQVQIGDAVGIGLQRQTQLREGIRELACR